MFLFGEPTARRCVALESGTHGVEGFTGSAIQLASVERASRAASERGLSILFVHAVNPYGFSFCRRGDENNVDVNRNFVDFTTSAIFANPLFDEMAPHLVPQSWDEYSLREADQAMHRLREVHGDTAVSRSMRRGQYTHPGNLFFGGTGPTWSRRTIEKIAADLLTSATSTLLLDVHTGLGDYAGLQLLTVESPDAVRYHRLRQTFGVRVRSTVDPSSGAANAGGNIFAGYERRIAPAEFTGLALEFGTYEQARVQFALRANAWAYLEGNAMSRDDLREQSRAEMLEIFCPADESWRRQVVVQGVEVFGQALLARGLGARRTERTDIKSI